MLILFSKKIIFIRTQKTASTSIEAGIIPYLEDEDLMTWDRFEGLENKNNPYRLNPHSPATEVRRKYPNEFSEFTTFAVERNPFDRVVSDYHWRKSARLLDGSKPSFCIPEDMSFDDYVIQRKFWTNEHMYTDNNELIIDVLFSYEHLQKTLPTFLRKRGINFTFPEERKKQTNKQFKSYTEYYNDETESIIRDTHRFSISKFGYDLGQTRPKLKFIANN